MPSSEITLEKLFLILHERMRLIGGLFAAGILVAGFITYLTPKMYTATTSINFEYASANPVDSSGRALAEDAYLFTQIDVIKSNNVAQKVEDNLTEYEQERLIAAFRAEDTVIDRFRRAIRGYVKALTRPTKASTSSSDGNAATTPTTDESEQQRLIRRSSYGWLARVIGRNLLVVPRFNSRIVDISYSSADPEITALMANRYAEAYVSTSLQMTIDPARKTAVWFDEQLKSLREKWEDAQSRLTSYQQKEGIVYTNEQLDTEAERLQKLSGQLVIAQQETRNAVTEQQELSEVLENDPMLLTFGTVFNNSVVQSIKKEIRVLEGQLVKISGSLGKNHPTRKRVSSELNATRQRLRAEVATIKDGINNRAELAKARENDLSDALARQKQLVLDLKQEHDSISVLQREVASAQSTYNAALNQMNTTRMQSMVDQANVTIIDTATVPRRHSSPQLKKNLVLGALAGLLLGVGITVLLAILVRRVHSTEDITIELGVPLLGHIK